jgi:thioredoxin-dependent peroxiredoxin
MKVSAGDPAPDFALPGTGSGNGSEPGRYSLAGERGHPVVLVFYPEDFSPVCTEQLASYTKALDLFESLDATVWGLSPQSVASHGGFAADADVGFPLLADEERSVASAYGVLGPLGFYRRCVFVVDATGTLRYVNRSMIGLQFQPSQSLLDQLERLG